MLFHVSVVILLLLVCSVIPYSIDKSQFICSPIGRHLDYFQFLPVVNKTAINVHIHIFFGGHMH